jgi:hypothetical protein
MTQIKPKFFGKIERGVFRHNDDDAFRKYMAKFGDGQEMEMTVGPKYKRRTSGQPDELTNFNGYYWAVVVRMISDEMGEIDDNYTHNMLQMIFNKRGVTVADPVTKKPVNIEVQAGSKYMSGGEFADYCSKIRTWASIPGNICDAGLYIPEPNETEWRE